MKRLMSLLAICLISTNVGCALCSNCDDYSYGAFGGLWERTDPVNGRVGSAFTPVGFSTLELEPAQTGQPEAEADLPETRDSRSEAPAPSSILEDDPSLET